MPTPEQIRDLALSYHEFTQLADAADAGDKTSARGASFWAKALQQAQSDTGVELYSKSVLKHYAEGS